MSRKTDSATLERIAGRIDENYIVHDYEGVNLRIVAKTLERDLPGLRDIVRSILSSD